MDDIKEMLVKLMEGQESMKIDIGSRFDGVESRLNKIIMLTGKQ